MRWEQLPAEHHHRPCSVQVAKPPASFVRPVNPLSATPGEQLLPALRVARLVMGSLVLLLALTWRALAPRWSLIEKEYAARQESVEVMGYCVPLLDRREG